MRHQLQRFFIVHPVLTVLLIFVVCSALFALAGADLAASLGLGVIFTLGVIGVATQILVREVWA